MVSDKIGFKLHDKFTRGLVLSDTEKQMLESWYAQKDTIERTQILKKTAGYAAENTLQAIAEAHKKLAYLTEGLQIIESENEQIGLENKRLRESLEKAIARQTA